MVCYGIFWSGQFWHWSVSKLVQKDRERIFGVGFSSFSSVTVFKKTQKQTWISNYKVLQIVLYILLTFILVSAVYRFFFSNFPQTVKFLLSVLTSLEG